MIDSGSLVVLLGHLHPFSQLPDRSPRAWASSGSERVERASELGPTVGWSFRTGMFGLLKSSQMDTARELRKPGAGAEKADAAAEVFS